MARTTVSFATAFSSLLLTLAGIGLTAEATSSRQVASDQVGAEQVVAFMIWGINPRSKPAAGGRWEVEGRDGVKTIYAINHLSECRFDASVERRVADTDLVLRLDYAFDFSAVHSYSARPANDRDERSIVKIEGAGWYDQTFVSKASGRSLQGTVKGDVHVFVAAGGPAERLHEAYRDFRSTHCRQRAS